MSIRLAAIQRMMESLLTVELAEKLVSVRANPALQARVDELGNKCNEGTLTPEEREEYETYVIANDYLAILQAKARGMLKHQQA